MSGDLVPAGYGLTPVTRPNGKIYQPRKGPIAYLLDNDDDWRAPCAQVLVVRTHDVARAHALALKLETVDPNPHPPTWFRLMLRSGGQVWVGDSDPKSWPACHGMPGMLFDVVDL